MKKKVITSVIVFASIASSAAIACSNVIWKSPEGVVLTRTMDWMESTQPLLLTVRAGETRNLHGTKTGGQYTVKNDYLAIAAYGNLIGEGVNEHGLHASLQFYSNMTAEKATKDQLSQNELAGYFLGNFKSVQDVLDNIKEIKFGLASIPGMQATPLWHYIISDKSGDRALIQHNKDGIKIYRGDDAQVVTNTSQDSLLAAWEKKEKALKGFGGYSSKFELGAGNTDSEQRFVFAKYFVSQLETATSPTNAMMAVEGAAFKVPQQAVYRPDIGMDTYATEYTITYNLNSGDIVFKYTGDTWSHHSWNYKEILASDADLAKQLY